MHSRRPLIDAQNDLAEVAVCLCKELEAAGLCNQGDSSEAEAAGLVLAVMAEHCLGLKSRCIQRTHDVRRHFMK